MVLPKPQNMAMIVGLCLLELSGFAQERQVQASIIAIGKTSLSSSKFLEFSPVFYGQGLLFVSAENKRKSRRKKSYFDIAYSKFDTSGQLTRPVFFKKLNTPYHDGPLCLGQDRKTVFITRSVTDEKGGLVADSSGLNRLTIWETSIAGEPSVGKRLPFCTFDYSVLHPALANHDTRLYFASDCPEGYGGMDIWYCEKVNDIWSTPIHLDSSVNSAANEVFPYIYEDSVLVFASDRVVDGVSTGLDIYIHELGSQKTTKLDAPINSKFDDFGLIVSPSGKDGYFSSNREGTDDIFSFKSNLELLATQKTIHFVFFNQTNHEPIKNATISLTGTSQDTLWATTNQHGQVSLQINPWGTYQLDFEHKGYFSLSKTIADSSFLVQTISINVVPKPCQSIKGMVHSMDLSLPISDVQFRIIPEIDSSLILSTKSDSKGAFSYCLPADWGAYRLVASKPGYISYEMSFEKGDIPDISLMPFDDQVVKQKIILENIYYDFNDSKIKESSALELVKLAQILKANPEVTILLVAYTDSRGAKRYNERLSRHRARAAKDFLVDLGVQANRITAIGRGEANIRNRCTNGVDCSEEEHRYNRRTEVFFRNIPENVMVIVKGEWDDGL